MLSLPFIISLASGTLAALSDASLKTYPNSLQIASDFNPVKAAYWTSLPHHRRTPFAVSPDGSRAYLAYLDSGSEAGKSGVHIQQVDPSTFAAVGSEVFINDTREAGGLVAHNDGFALLTNQPMVGVEGSPPDGTPVAVLYRYTNGQQTFKTWLGGPSLTSGMGLSMTPDINGDLVWSEQAQRYAAYYVVTNYEGSAAGHFGDAIRYIDPTGAVTKDTGTSAWGCSHNTGIALEAADAVPFASACAEDHGAMWLNTGGKGMSGTKISNEYVINGASNEATGGMSGSYSNLARFQNSGEYIMAWVSRGASDLLQDTWRGNGFTTAANRTEYRRVAITMLKDKATLAGPAASSTLGDKNADSQIYWVSDGPADASNPRVATFDGTSALVSWDQIDQPIKCNQAMDCAGVYSGAYYQLVTAGQKSGPAIHSPNVFVSGDQVTMKDGRICWPYVETAWQSEKAVGGYRGATGATTKSISFACMTNGVASNDPAPAPPASSSSAAPAPPSSSEAPAPPPSSSAAPVPTSEAPAPAPTTAEAPVPAPEQPTVAPEQPTATGNAPTEPTEVVPEPTGGEYESPPINPSASASASASAPPAPSAPVNVPGGGSTPTFIAPTTSAAASATADPEATAAPSSEAPACKVEWVTVYV